MNLSNLKSSGVVFALLLTACDDGGVCPPGQEQTTGTYILFKSSAFDRSEWQQIAIIHGWSDDAGACGEVVEMLHRTEPGRYRCERVADFCLEDHSYEESPSGKQGPRVPATADEVIDWLEESLSQ